MSIFYKLIIFLIVLNVQADFCFGFKEHNLKYKVTRIEIEGNKNISDHTIKKIMLTKDSGWFSRSIFYENLFRDDIKSIIQLYHNFGYLDVNVSSEVNLIAPAEKKLLLKINIVEGQPTFVDTIFFSGNRVFDDARLRKLISLKQNKPFNESLLEKDNYSLLAYYAQEGYIDAVINPELKRDKENHLIFVNFVIKEGIKVRIKDIAIDGLEKTKPIVVRRELLLKPTEVFNYAKIMESQHRLYQTGLFRSISIKPVLDDSLRPELRDVKVSVIEQDNGEINFGVGFGSFDKLRGSFEVFQNNFQGMSKQIGCRLRISFKQQRFEFSFTNPWLFKTQIKYDLNTFMEHKIEPNYELKSWGGRTTTGKNISQFGKVTLSYKYEDVGFSNIIDTVVIKEEKSRGNTRSLLLSFIRDSRDSQFNTTSGSYFDLMLESAGGFLKGTNTFFKITTEERLFINLKESPVVILGIRIFAGWMDNFGKSLTIPLNERFYAGGDGSIRGYYRREIGPKTSQNVPNGGKISFISNVEFRYPVYRKFGATLFWDMGNVWRDISRTQPFKIRHGVGCGLRYHSPLGIIRIDFGMKVNRQANESFGEVYFTLGQIF